MQSGVPFVQLPCMGVVDKFYISKQELEFWLKGKNAIADYLATNTIEVAEAYGKGRAWTRIIWDVTAVAWLLNDSDRFMSSKIIPTRVSTYDNVYDTEYNGYPMRYVYNINRDELMNDLIKKILTEFAI